MTCSVYVFGNMGKGYTQYPDDYAIKILQEFKSLSTAPSQVIIHRDNNLMYYGYIRGLDNLLGYIGFCVLVNGMMLTQISQLFKIFEEEVAEMATKGEIISLNNKEEIIPVISSLNEKVYEIGLIASDLQNRIAHLMENAIKLPPVNYDVSVNSKKYFSILDEESEIVDATGKYGYTYVSKHENPDSAQLTGYKGVIRQMRDEKIQLEDEYKGVISQMRDEHIQLEDEYNRLKNKYSQLERQSKNPVVHEQDIPNESVENESQKIPPKNNQVTPSIVGKWNWGAFWFGGLWGLFNGVYWPLVLILPLNIAFPSMGWVPSLIVNIYLGAKGNELSWKSNNWTSVEEFEQRQKGCSTAALVFFIISIALLFVVILTI